MTGADPERRTYFVYLKPIDASLLRLGSLVCSISEPVADDNGEATIQRKKRIKPHQPDEGLLNDWIWEPPDPAPSNIRVTSTPTIGGEVKVANVVTGDAKRTRGRKVIVEGKKGRRLVLKTPHEDALEYLLEHSKTAKKWLQVYLSVGNKLYLQEMLLGKGPQVYLLTGIIYFTDCTVESVIARHSEFKLGGGIPDPTGITGPLQNILEANVHRGNHPDDHSTQKAHYAREVICAAQYRRLDLNFLRKKGKGEVKLPLRIPLLDLVDWADGVCADDDEDEEEGDSDTVNYTSIEISFNTTPEEESELPSGEMDDSFKLAEVDEEEEQVDWEKMEEEMKELMEMTEPD